MDGREINRVFRKELECNDNFQITPPKFNIYPKNVKTELFGAIEKSSCYIIRVAKGFLDIFSRFSEFLPGF